MSTSLCTRSELAGRIMNIQKVLGSNARLYSIDMDTIVCTGAGTGGSHVSGYQDNGLLVYDAV
jgi:hypothetical protein